MTGLSPAGGCFDDVVVGAGSAGAVLAARLTQRPRRRVLLLEAGPDLAEPDQPVGPLGHSVLTGANWDHRARLDSADGEHRWFPYPVGKAVGGSSAVNAAIALRGLPSDFDRWAAAGNPEWAWGQVEPYFIRLEADADATGPGHGQHGPIPIRRPRLDQLDAVASAFWRACSGLGLPALADLNGEPGVGVGPVPSNCRDGRRVSTADAYLAPARSRPNLTICASGHVDRVLLSGGRAVGVEAVIAGRTERVSAGQVTLCAGAVGSPGILERSGIGHPNRLAQLGIDPLLDLPGVGENLADHPVLALWALPQPDLPTGPGPWHAVMARLASPAAGEPDTAIFLATDVTGVAVPVISSALNGRRAVSVSVVLLAPRSRGSVHVTGPEPDRSPDIALPITSSPADLSTLLWGARTAWSLVRGTPMAELLTRVLIWTDRMMADDTLAAAAIRRFAAPMWHPVGTARMGPASDAMSVVDQRCRVHAVSGLRVVDASVMPSVPRATPNLSCVMLAERVAEWMS